MFVHFSKAAFLASVSLVTLALGCASARAGSVSWTGAANNNDWFDDANWEWGSGAPTAADDARIDQTGMVLTGQAGAAAEFFVGISNEADRMPEFMKYEKLPPHNQVWDVTEEEHDSFWD